MKRLTLGILLLSLLSCKPEYKTVNTVEVVFENGEIDTFQSPYIKNGRMRDNNGDYRKVVSKYIIKTERIKNK